ncbi:MAG: hypothetical protein GY822_30860 [Deltaproteobacteria bacterium]|nr:hypothetical protein [Deltaproteobacteria bacterium]
MPPQTPKQNQTLSPADRKSHVSVAMSFGNEDDLARLGVAVIDISCPECGANGKRIGGGNDPLELKGFQKKTHGGKKAVLAKCEKCEAQVSFVL